MSSKIDELNQILKEKTAILLQREKEMFGLRQLQDRTLSWLTVFKRIALEVGRNDTGAVFDTWSKLLLEHLPFQIAVAFRRLPQNRFELTTVPPNLRMPRVVSMDQEVLVHLEATEQGSYPNDESGVLDAIARQLGVTRFFWLMFTCRENDQFLLLAGHEKDAAEQNHWQESDLGHFTFLGNYVATLVDNVSLNRNIDAEREELRISNERLLSEIEERARLEKELRHSQKMEALGHLAAGIGHEINNPLAYVIENLSYVLHELYVRRSANPDDHLDEIYDVLREAFDGAERIKNIIKNVRLFSGPLEAPPAPMNIVESLDAAIRMTQNEVRHKAALTKRFNPVPSVLADPHRLAQVFVNLLMNAVQALPERKARAKANRITIETAVLAGANEVLVAIEDNGCGISEAARDRIFDPFFTTRKVGQGTGLGLAICRSIVESFGGSIEVHSRDGEGTRVEIRLLAEACESEQMSRSSSPPTVGRTSHPAPSDVSILLVDDEPAVLRSLKRVLNVYDITICQSGQDALALYRKQPFELVFCDLMMPDFSGIDFYHALEKLGPEHARKIVFMTGGAFSDEARHFLKGVENLCIDKPFDIQKIHQLIYDEMMAS